MQKVYDLATTIVKRLGMSEKIGYLSFKDDEIVKIYSEETQKVGIIIFFLIHFTDYWWWNYENYPGSHCKD